MTRVRKVVNEEELEQAFKIREEVFIKEQEVNPEEEFDEFENSSTHFLAFDKDGNPCGTGRWRVTEHGIKLERFAVLSSCRMTGVGQSIVKAVLSDIENDPNVSQQKIYMHAQTAAIDFYKKFGFEVVGNEFVECGIKHFTMEK
ncbi:putative GNAT family N-acyltransferase [Catalinimonas alkaloidigena]|uniref:GNAT family N-acetyltransferase n=1 Tax=Catalinimonas alkaloidigena TaxID=1075417 RepID=UPI002404E4C1|nr:GNAT family N-acetyltransferase [Catalinimonas alkaloidigena]MDF9795867.1 putative GNAT family N-acyltransferase [Catalinimonas alkaloidigena]